MAQTFSWISVDQVIGRLRRNLGVAFDVDDAIEWMGEALSSIGVISYDHEAIVHLEVKDHEARLPSGLTSIIQVAKDTCNYTKPVTECDPPPPPDANPEVIITCANDSRVIAHYPYLEVAYSFWNSSSLYKSCFTPVRLASHTFFSNLVCRTTHDVYADAEYNIYPPYLRFSFKTGSVVLAYRKTPTDKRGFPMIPDVESVFKAVEAYVRYKVALMRFDRGDQGAGSYLSKTEQDWHWYCAQAQSYALMPSLDELENKRVEDNYFVPQSNYYGFFGNVNLHDNIT